MKLRYIIAIFLLSIGVLIGIVKYYGIDPSLLSSLSFYADLANPSIRIVRVQEGLRKEEIANVMADKLGWDEIEKEGKLFTEEELEKMIKESKKEWSKIE